MEKTLKILFDFQKLRGNERLSRMIDEVGQAHRELRLDELALVNAAGSSFDERKIKETNDNDWGNKA